jgi:ADP-heptose:LPS heptosyltransferase
MATGAVPKWNKSDDAKLLDLINRPNNGIDLSRGKENVKRIHKHWPNRQWKNFATLIRGKLQDLKTARLFHGGRRCKFSS